MFYKKINLLENSTTVTDCVNKLIANITQTYSSFISVTKNENTISFNDVAKNRKIFDLTIQSDNNGVGITLYRAIGNVSRLQQFGLTTGTVFDETFGSSCGYLNYPTEFITINKTTFAISLGPLNNSTYPGTKKPGILIFTKSIKGNIAIIQPSYMIGVGKNTESNPTFDVSKLKVSSETDKIMLVVSDDYSSYSAKFYYYIKNLNLLNYISN